jgi:hypothetical protein
MSRIRSAEESWDTGRARAIDPKSTEHVGHDSYVAWPQSSDLVCGLP